MASLLSSKAGSLPCSFALYLQYIEGHGRRPAHCMQCAELSAKLAEDLASEGLQGKAIMLKLKETSFELRTRNKMLPTYISSGEDIFREAMKLLKPEMPIKIRLMVRLLYPS